MVDPMLTHPVLIGRVGTEHRLGELPVLTGDDQADFFLRIIILFFQDVGAHSFTVSCRSVCSFPLSLSPLLNDSHRSSIFGSLST